MEDATLNWVSENSESLRRLNCHVLISSPESIQIAQDKGKTLAVRRKLQIPVPEYLAARVRRRVF